MTIPSHDRSPLPQKVRRFTLPMPPPLAHVHVWLIETGGGWAISKTVAHLAALVDEAVLARSSDGVARRYRLA